MGKYSTWEALRLWLEWRDKRGWLEAVPVGWSDQKAVAK